jgi:hypothetical protein
MVIDGKSFAYIWWPLDTFKGMLANRAEIMRDNPKNPCDLF